MKCELQPAIREYEAKMRTYGFAAVRAALRMQRLGTLSNPMAVDAMRIWFRICTAIPPLKRMTFRSTWARHARPSNAS